MVSLILGLAVLPAIASMLTETVPERTAFASVVVAQRSRPPEADSPPETRGAPPPRSTTEPPPAKLKSDDKEPGVAGPSQSRAVPIETSPDFVPILDRWRIGFPDWNRYERPLEAPYTTGRWWDPYNQNVLKGDYPIFGQHYFLNVAAISDSLLELRRVPVPSNASAAQPSRAEFFGSGDQIFVNQNFILSFSFFKGDTAFRPRDWEIRVTPVFNLSYLDTRETGVVNVDVRKGTTRYDSFKSLQELFVEYHLGDLSPHYDFASVRAGIQPFTSDFRGFIFSDDQLGFRLFGNLGSNRYQYNAAYFRPLEKDTNSGLNHLFDTRSQHLGIVNFFAQDFIWPGYTVMANLHVLNDSGDKHFDANGFLIRPAPVGTLSRKVVNAVWLGWNGDGHIGPINVTHAFYQVWGRENRNPINDRAQDISAQMAAVEISTDLDWFRPRAAFFWASGDSKPEDHVARGFDTIFDNPNFAGGGFSYWVRQGLPLTGTGLELVGRNSLVPSLRSSKIEGQPNFINPGLFLFNVGADIELTPKVKAIVNVNYLRFHHTQILERLLSQPTVQHDIGIDYSVGVRWRPFLIDNVVVTGGVGILQALDGLRDVYTNRTFTFTNRGLEKTTTFPYDVLYSAFLSVTLTF
jgi:hypothetical protein